MGLMWRYGPGVEIWAWSGDLGQEVLIWAWSGDLGQEVLIWAWSLGLSTAESPVLGSR